LHAFINRLAEQCERHRVEAELILVEWNPPEARAPLADVLGWPAGSRWFSARIVTVPRQLHFTHKALVRLQATLVAAESGVKQSADALAAVTAQLAEASDERERLRVEASKLRTLMGSSSFGMGHRAGGARCRGS
jgi:hypothetical protein